MAVEIYKKEKDHEKRVLFNILNLMYYTDFSSRHIQQGAGHRSLKVRKGI